MKKFTLLFLSVFMCGVLFSQSKYSRITVYFDEAHGIHQLVALGVACDHGEHKHSSFLTTDFSAEEIKLIADAGFRYTTEIDDVSRYYENQNHISHKNSRSVTCGNSSSVFDIVPPANFQLGSMGGFYTYQELLNILDSMHAKYPNLISAKQPIDTFHTIEGRPIYWVKISDNPTLDEAEPEILFTAIHHAREPAGITNLVFYVWKLLESYSTNPESAALINNTEFYLVPCLNPDGYLYNQSTNPSGGGMWRKNRRQNADGTYGVDLNRNYGHLWGFDDNGSSPTPSSETYRGTAAFSEPETQASKWFCENHNFKIAINYHTYGNDLIYPWGYTENTLTPDSNLFITIASEMTKINNYTIGTGNQTVGYNVNGDSDDWMYGEQSTKNKILAMTPEAGSQDFGFWPPSSEIIPICKDNYTLINNAHRLLLRYMAIKDKSDIFTNSRSFTFKYTSEVLGLDTACTYAIRIEPADGLTTTSATTHSITNPRPLQTDSNSFTIQINSSVTTDTTFRFVVVTDNGNYIQRDTFAKFYLQADTIYYNNCNAMTDFISNGTWGVTSAASTSGGLSLTDSPNGNYQDNDFSSLILNNAIDLTTAKSATLVFNTKFNLEKEYDFVQLEINTENNTAWQTLCSNLKTHTIPNGYNGSQTWTTEIIPLDSYIGEKIKLKFTLSADQFMNEDGFYIDDLTILGKLDSTATGIGEIASADNFILYPNPSTGKLTIRNNSTTPIAAVTVSNLLGQTVFSSQSEQYQFDFSFLTNGIYTIHILSKNGERQQLKWMKE